MSKKKCAALSDDTIHAYSLLKLGITLNNVQQQQEALYYMDRARTVFQAVGHTLYLARAYHSISLVHLDECKFPDALDAAEKAWEYAELTASRYSRTTIPLTLGRILFNTNQDTRAWKYIELSLTNASFIGNRYQAALALECMGYGYLRRGDYQNAYGAYEAAVEKFLGTTGNVERCKDNMARIQRKQENYDAVISFYRPSLDTEIILFYPPVQVFASEPPISHS